MRTSFFYLLLAFFLFLSGCGAKVEQPTLEDIGLISILGYDKAGDQYEITGVQPQFSKSAESKTQVHSATTRSHTAALIDFNAESAFSMTPTYLQVVLISEELARQGDLFRISTALYRDNRVGDNVLIAVVKGSAKEILSSKFPEHPDVTRYLRELLKPRRSTAFHPFLTLHEFMYLTSSQTADSLIPYIELINGKISITKVAVFKKTNMINTISRREGVLAVALNYGGSLNDIIVRSKAHGKEEKFEINLLKATNAQRWTPGNPPHLDLKLQLSGNLVEFSGDYNLEVEKERIEMEKIIAASIKKDLLHLLQKFKKWQVDPSEIMGRIRASTKEPWDISKGWKILEQSKIRLHVEFNLNSSGTIK